MTPAPMLAQLQAWRRSGWLRPLDLAFAGLLNELEPQAPASLLLAAALLTHLEGQGHSCLPLAGGEGAGAATRAWPADDRESVATVLECLPADAATAMAAWGGSPLLEVDPQDGDGNSPLVLCDGRLYLRRYWRCEWQVAAQVRVRARDDNAAAVGVDVAKARALLDRLFPASAAPADVQAVDWQKVACALALRGRLTIVSGGPGTGKTYTAARLLVLLQALHAGPQPLRVALAAPTGKAAARLRQSIDGALQGLKQQLGEAWTGQVGPARTLHSLLGARPGTRRFVHDAVNPLEVDLLFVDEASMVHLEMMAVLLDALPGSARVVLLGDRDQLASVEAGAVMGDLCQAPDGASSARGYRPATLQWLRDVAGQVLPPADAGHGDDLAQQTLALRESRRFAGPIGQLALAVNRGDTAAAVALLKGRADGEVSMFETRDAAAVPALAVDGRAGARGGYRGYLETLARRPADAAAFGDWAMAVLARFDGFRVLCALRDGPWGASGLNAAIETALSGRGLLQRRGDWYEGRPVMVTRNDAALGVFNGDIGIVLKPPGAGDGLRAYFADGSELRSVAVGRLADVETAFAMTVHKSQGSEFEHVALVLPDEDSPVLTRELVYTGITRARKAFTLVAADSVQFAAASGRLTRRLSGVRAMLGRTSG